MLVQQRLQRGEEQAPNYRRTTVFTGENGGCRLQAKGKLRAAAIPGNPGLRFLLGRCLLPSPLCLMENPAPVQPELRILAVDIGGTGIKADVLDVEANLLTERVRIKTPEPPLKPDTLLSAIVRLVEPLKSLEFNRISVGFPGVVRRGVILTAPNLGTETLGGFDLAAALAENLGYPTRIVNDADMQGLAVVTGKGVEMVITLGTGMGSALFSDGELGPHLELSHHPFRKGETYEQQIGNLALKKIGAAKWNRRVKKAIKNLRVLTNFDHLFIGGGNAKEIDFKLDDDVTVVDNSNGIKGGTWLWRQRSQPD